MSATAHAQVSIDYPTRYKRKTMSDTSAAFLSEQEIMIRDAARKVAQEVVGATAAERDRTGAWPHAELKAVADLGFLGMQIPEEAGGAGMSFPEYCLCIEEFAAADAGFATILHVHNGMTDMLHRFGTELQKQKYLAGMISGELIAAGLLTEPQAGSDTAAFRTTARRDGDHYVLNGSKQFISNGSEAGIAFAIAATTETTEGRKGPSMFIIDPREPGYIVTRVESKMGQRSAHVAAIQLDNCRVPAHNLLAEEGTAYKRLKIGRAHV